MKLSKWKLLALIAGFVFVADQWTKVLAVQHLTRIDQVTGAQDPAARFKVFLAEKDLQERGLSDAPIVVLPDYWQFVYAQNRGAAFSFLAGAGEKFRVPFFYLVSIAAVIFIFSYYRKLTEQQRYLQVALALVLGGAIGNALDRVIRGYVIDFIDWHLHDLHWPVFNIADSGISVGLVLLFLDMLLAKKTATREASRPGPG
jgi:signal peptidase II